MPSQKRRMNKEKPAVIMKRLLRLSKRIQKDEAEFLKIRQSWYNEYLYNTGAIEFLKKNNLSNVCSEYDLVYAVLPIEHIQRVIDLVTEQFIKDLEAKKALDIPSVT